jgi:hypothetical protein
MKLLFDKKMGLPHVGPEKKEKKDHCWCLNSLCLAIND